MERTFHLRIRNIRTNRLIWFIATIVMISLLFPPFQISKNCTDDHEGYHRKISPYNENFRLPYYFCQALTSKKCIAAYSSSFSYFSASAAPVNSKSDASKKKNVKEKKNTDKVECLIDKTKGFKNAANIYQCASRQTCCFEYAKPSCCGSKPALQIIQEQVTLWGGLLAILAFISAIVFCRRKDFSLDFSKLLSCGYCCDTTEEKETGAHISVEKAAVGTTTEVTKKSFLKKCNKVGTLDTYSNTTVNKLKDSLDQKNTNENNLFHKKYSGIEDKNIRNLNAGNRNGQLETVLGRVQ